MFDIPQVSTILTRLKGHTDRVNSIQWLPTQGCYPLYQHFASSFTDIEAEWVLVTSRILQDHNTRRDGGSSHT